MKNPHDVDEIVLRHLRALYEETDEKGACNECIVHALMASAVGSIINEYGAGMVLVKFIDSAVTFAVESLAEGTTETISSKKPLH